MRILCAKKLTVAGLAIVTLLASTWSLAGEHLSLNSGIFNKQQALSGKALYKKNCQSCHEGSYFAPVLLAWQGEALSSFFELMSSAMPENDPGALEKSQYTEILAYILKTSGYLQGSRSLDPDTVEFAKIKIERPR